MKYLNLKRMDVLHPFLLSIIFIILITGSYSIAKGQVQTDKDKDMDKTISDHVFNLDFSNASTLLESTSMDKRNAQYWYLVSLNRTTDLLINDKYHEYSDNEYVFDSCISEISNLPDQDSLKLICTAEIYFHHALVDMHFNGITATAANHLRKSYNQLQRSLKKHPDLSYNYKLHGLYNVLLSQIPENYQWLFDLFGFHGNYDTGIDLLEKASNYQNIFQNESKLHLFFIRLKYEQQAVPEHESKNGLILHKLLYAHSLILQNDFSAAEKILNLIYLKSKTNFCNYMLADINLNKGYFKKATLMYLAYINNSQGNTYITSTRLNLFYCYYLTAHKEKAVAKLEEIKKLDLPATYTKDKIAKKYVRDFASFPNEFLLRSRLYYDGNNLDKALESLKNFEIKTNLKTLQKSDCNLTEYYYRKGRIYQKKQDTSLFRNCFEQVISNDCGNLFYKAKSNLELGKMHLNQKNLEKGKLHLQQSIAFKQHDYEHEIELEAKNLLHSLKK